MKLGALLQEAGRNIATGTARLALLSMAFGAALGCLIALDAAAITQQVKDAERFSTSGAATVIISAPGRVSPAACEGLAVIPGVAAAGALRESSRRTTLSALPGAPVPTYDVSPDFPRHLAPEWRPSSTGVLISSDIAHTLGVTSGQHVATSEGPATVAGIFDYPSDGRRPGFAYALLSATADQGSFDECWVTAWPQIDNLRGLMMMALRPGAASGSDRPRVMQLNSTLGSEFMGTAAFLSRPTGAGPAVGAIVGLGLGYFSLRLRRLEVASALHSGVARRDVVAIHLLEATAWSACAAALAVGAGLGTAGLGASVGIAQIALNVAGIPLAGLAAAPLGVALAALTIGEKHLVRYVTDR